jgi:hypothetical protein
MFFERDVEVLSVSITSLPKQKISYPANKQMIERIGQKFQISFAKLNGELLAAHSYLVDERMGISQVISFSFPQA